MSIFKFSNLSKRAWIAGARRLLVSIATFVLTFIVCHVQAAPPSQTPLFLSVGAKPHIALVMSVDHELFKKAYTDYANLDGNKLEMKDTSYRDDFDYYGYYDSDWCYSYSEDTTSQINSHFVPAVAATAPATGTTKKHQCVGTSDAYWSGNFLNWVSMSRMDIVRRVLFGGKRSLDSASKTILERAYLPKDVHAFAKVYGSSTVSIAPYTPYAAGTTYSFCNVSTSEDVATGYPLIRVATGSWPLWATVESGYHGGNCTLATSGTLMPSSVYKDYTAKVEACVTDANATITVGSDLVPAPRCRKYGSIYKPSGLLQKYGESGEINFSLMSGSYKANHKGGVLRKAAGALVSSPANASVDEINTATGQFNDVPGIIRNISKFRISTYSFSSKTYKDCSGWSIPIVDFKTGVNSDTSRTLDTKCRDWGNPLSEIYLETLRYISGKLTATAVFDVDDSSAEDNYPGIAGLSKSTWNDPWPADQYCAKCSIIVLSTGSNSFDGDDLSAVTDLSGLTEAGLSTKTDSVGTQEYGSFGSGKNFFMGGLDAKSRYCKSFSLTGLSSYTGICPELPALEGGYQIAGLAHYARTTDLRPTLSDGPGGIYKQKVNTYAVDLAESVPTIPIVIGENTLRILPACESNINGSAVDESDSKPWSTCSLFDVKVQSLIYSGANLVKGSMSFYWEDSLWGYDYDLDVEQRLEFCVGPTTDGCNDTTVGASEIRITNTIPYAEAGNALRLSYSIYGVSNFKGTWTRNSAVTTIATTSFSGGLVSPWMLRPGGTNYSGTIPANVGTSTFTFAAGSSNVELPKKPLFLAAKYGGFTDLKKNEATSAALVDDTLDYVKEWDNYKGLQDTVPDNFFSVKNPALLEESLDNIFTNILRRTSSASAVATSSTRLQEGQFVYQAIFDSSNWSGELKSYEITPAGVLPSAPTLTTRAPGTMPETGAGRNVYTYKSDGTFSANNGDGSSRDTVRLEWARLHSSQQTKLALTGDVAGTAEKRANWLVGNKTDEDALTGLRVRDFEDASGSPYRNILGDIVNSSPAFVGAYNYRYYSLPNTMGGDSYLAYLTKKRDILTRDSVPRVFVGSNDGMLHAFNANTMRELFAYVPNAVFHKLAKLTERDYGTGANPHQFLVDGPIVSGDAFISTPSDSTRKWRSIVVGTFGAGAKGIYALDVTNQDRPEVLFEYAHANMGYILGKPFIAPTAEGRWAVITGNGVDSGGAVTSKLFVVDLELPYSKTKIIDTTTGAGLSAPALLTDAIGVAKTVFAGDLSGNMWRFSIDDIPTSWTFYKVFTANRGTSGSPILQPIVAAPTVGYNAKLAKNMVYFGTGKYHDDIDKSVGSVRHSFYAVPDMGATGTPVTRSNLIQKSMTTNYTSGAQSRTVTEANPNWTTKKGWYIDLDYSTASKRDERITTKAILLQDKLIITTLIPSDASCLPGGSSWLMQVTAVGDRYVSPVTNVLVPPTGGETTSAPAFYSEELFLGDLNVALMGEAAGSPSGGCGSDLELALINSGTSASSPKAVEGLMKACMVGRQSWRQLN